MKNCMVLLALTVITSLSTSSVFAQPGGATPPPGYPNSVEINAFSLSAAPAGSGAALAFGGSMDYSVDPYEFFIHSVIVQVYRKEIFLGNETWELWGPESSYNWADMADSSGTGTISFVGTVGHDYILGAPAESGEYGAILQYNLSFAEPDFAYALLTIE